MPLYEYQCENCSCTFDLRRGFSDNSDATCPQCQGGARRIFSPVPIIFKGSGFYVTDSRNKPDHKRNGKKPATPAKEKKEKTTS